MTAAYAPSGLLERERELEQLGRAWREAAAGRGSTWLLCAEAGGGKTRLAREVVASVGRDRTRWGAAEPVAPPDPFLAISRAIPSFEPAATRAGSVARVLEALDVVEGALLLVLDDLHYADEGTVAVLVRLAEESRSRRWLILTAFRPEEGTPALREAASEIVAQGRAQRLDLAPLSRAAVGALANAIRRQPITPSDLDAIYGDSGGNPWFAEALARGHDTLNVVRERIVLRLDRLAAAHPHAHEVLRALAPATRPLPYAVVADLGGGDTAGLRADLARLRDGGFLRETAEGWGFHHELLRRALLDVMVGADRRDVHRALAVALEGTGRAAEIAMHYAAADDARAVAWSLRAADEARASDAHTEALAQLERALSFEMDPDQRRGILIRAAAESWDLNRIAEIQRFVDEALALPGATPETIATLHQQAARAANRRGDHAADEAHLAAAERALEGRPATTQTVQLALARLARAAVDVQPERVAPAAERALRLAYEVGDDNLINIVEVQTRSFRVYSLLDAGDPTAFAVLEEAVERGTRSEVAPGAVITALANAYEEAVVSLFHRQARTLWERTVAAVERHGLDWVPVIAPWRVLELVQRGDYAGARSLIEELSPAPGAIGHVILTCAAVLREARSGGLDRARALLSAVTPSPGFQQQTLHDLARLELAIIAGEPNLGELAQRLYWRANQRRYARVAGAAAVALARSGRGAPPAPGWLVPDAPLRVFWDWGDGINRRDAAALRGVAARLEEMACPYEAAIALRDAGDLTAAYRSLRALGATTERAALAELLRTAGQRIPRRTRAALDRDGLTETELRVCELVVTGASNEEIAERLVISARTVAGHLTSIYLKTGRQGRTALVIWWGRRSNEETASP